MSGKLDQSLDEIVGTGRTSARRGRGSRVHRSTRTTAAPVGGVKKTTRTAKAPAKAVATTAVVAPTTKGESKIIVTGLPSDVNEQQIKEYFAKTIGPVRKVFLTYGPTGQSRGVATIIFRDAKGATEAATKLNGVKVDNRAMRIEVIVGANQVPAAAPVKTLGERIIPSKTATTAKTQPKSATKVATKATASARGRGRTQRGRNAGRAKVKTAEELDAEMTDYFGSGTGGPANGAAAANGANGTAAPATGGDVGMDEIL